MTSGPAEIPIACQLKALTPAERERQKQLLGLVRGKIRRAVELERGWEMELPSDTASFMEIAEWVNLERRCCAFAEFVIQAGIDGRVLVRVTGGEGAKEVLGAEMGIGPPVGERDSREATRRGRTCSSASSPCLSSRREASGSSARRS